MPAYRRLDEANIVATIQQLAARIAERFPGAGLGKVCAELLVLASEARETVAYVRRPIWPLRAAVALTIAGMLGVIVFVATTIKLPAGISGFGDAAQAIEASINDIIFVGIAVFFLATVEGRLKRHRALKALHELRSVVHIVDMHQLTKDPERLLSPQPDTPSSPVRAMTEHELGRYLDYCSEMLSLTSKLSALYVQDFNDPIVLAAVGEIETLAGSLSNKIWQKITLLERAAHRPDAALTARA